MQTVDFKNSVKILFHKSWGIYSTKFLINRFLWKTRKSIDIFSWFRFKTHFYQRSSRKPLCMNSILKCNVLIGKNIFLAFFEYFFYHYMKSGWILEFLNRFFTIFFFIFLFLLLLLLLVFILLNNWLRCQVWLFYSFSCFNLAQLQQIHIQKSLRARRHVDLKHLNKKHDTVTDKYSISFACVFFPWRSSPL